MAKNKLERLQKTTIKRLGKNMLDFDSMLDATGMPELPVNTETDVEAIVNRETDDMMSLIRENRKNSVEHFRDIEAGEFWFCVCFQSFSQKQEFLTKMLEKFNPNDDLSRFGNKYVSGLELAAALGIEITPIVLEVKRTRLAPKSLRRMEVI